MAIVTHIISFVVGVAFGALAASQYINYKIDEAEKDEK